MTQPPGADPAFAPPRLFRLWLAAFLNAADRKSVLHDLEELFRHRVLRDGPAPAALWLRRQFRHYPTQLIKERLASLLNSPSASVQPKNNAWLGGRSMIATLWRDARHALRGFRRSPGFVAVATLTLALGIGANTAIFSVVNGVLLEPLPYSQPDQLIALMMTNEARGDMRGPWSVPTLREVATRTETFQTISGYQWMDYTLTGVGEPELVNAVGVTASTLQALGVNPFLGRDIRADETEFGGPTVAVLSHAFWMERFGGETGVLGRTIQLSDIPFEVIGIAPPGFEYPPRAELWVPGQWDPETYPPSRYFLRAIGRLSPDATIEVAEAELAGIVASLAEEDPQSNAPRGVSLLTLTEYHTGDVRLALFIMFGAVGLVLLIACVNVANLMLARGSTRVGEMAIRTTLGASRIDIVRQLLVESVLLSLAGTALGLILAVWGVQGLVAFSPGNIPRLQNVDIDGTVMLFAAGLAVLVALGFGLTPAFRLAGTSISSIARDGKDTEAGFGRKRALRSGLLIVEMAVSLILVVAAGLLLKSFAQIRSVDLGFDPIGVQQFTLSLPASRYNDEQMGVFFKTLEERVATIPGVEAVGMNSGSPLGHSHTSIGFDIVGRPPFTPEQTPFLLVRRTTPGYFGSVRIPLLAGRSFDATDRNDTPLVTVVSQTVADRYFPGENPIGKQFTFDQGQTAWTIIGVVGDVRSLDVTTETEPEAYFPLTQWIVPTMTVTVRSATGVAGLVPQLRREVASLDPALALRWVETLEQRVDVSVGQDRFNLLLLSLFAGLAVVLTATGLYGVVAYLVSRRTREIGIRIALGANWSNVAKLVLWQGMLPTVVGTVLGILGAIAATRVLSSLLYQVDSWDPTAYVLGASVLFAVALLASFVPARGAVRIPPTEAIKAE